MTDCQEATKAYPEKMEANPEEMQSKAVHQEVPKEEAVVETGRALNKQLRGQHLATGRRDQLEERTQGNCGSRK
jgi:hypothetical protein